MAKAMRWATRKRMNFIRDHLDLEGTLNRSTIMKYFGVSQPQASADIKQFLKLYPKSMKYNPSKKCFVSLRRNRGRRDTTAAANSLMNANDSWLAKVAAHDPDMIRDVAAALIYERG